MIFVGYGSLAIGLLLLTADLFGRFRAPPARVRSLARTGVVGAAAVGVTPLLLLLSQALPPWAGGLGELLPLTLVALAYLALAIIFVVGVLGKAGDRTSTRLRRAAYLGFLMIAVIPTSLLLLTPFITLAGLALVRPAGRSDEMLR